MSVDKKVILNPIVLVNNTTLAGVDGTDISAYVESATVNGPLTELVSTCFGDGATNNEAGLEDPSLQLNLVEGAAMSGLDGVLYPLRGTKIFVSVKTKTGSISTDNPAFQNKLLLAGNYSWGGAVNTLAKKSITLKSAGTAWTRATS